MSASLVGSEMCIRDSLCSPRCQHIQVMPALVRPAGVAGPRSPVWQDTCVPALASPFRLSGHMRASA
eukprot:8980341-Alexandrium_andersonii.AAC.1